MIISLPDEAEVEREIKCGVLRWEVSTWYVSQTWSAYEIETTVARVRRGRGDLWFLSSIAHDLTSLVSVYLATLTTECQEPPLPKAFTVRPKLVWISRYWESGEALVLSADDDPSTRWAPSHSAPRNMCDILRSYHRTRTLMIKQREYMSLHTKWIYLFITR